MYDQMREGVAMLSNMVGEADIVGTIEKAMKAANPDSKMDIEGLK
jgi:hypothetical protein